MAGATNSEGGKIGPYEILGLLGAGGMGEVYRARDPRLSRDVAVKRVRNPGPRFEQEARAAGQLNHPNLVAVYVVGVDYVVMELVDGDSLRVILEQGPVPQRRLLDIGAQIADGLGAAHAAGIVHRDLKPENIIVDHNGRVRILDFGLAKQSGPMRLDSRADTITDPGTVMGTVGYMSPEQVRGQVVDPRSDIFSLGVLLYEMATGHRAFAKETSAETMTAILKEEPLEPETHVSPGLAVLIRRCMEKEPARRFQSAIDLAFALRNLTQSGASPVVQAGSPGSLRWLWVGIPVALLMLLLGIFWIGSRPAQFSMEPPRYDVLTYQDGRVGSARFAPDGQLVVYDASTDIQSTRLYLWDATTGESRPLPGIEGATVIGVSPRRELVTLRGRGFRGGFGGRLLARVPLDGGAPRELLEGVVGASWAPDGESIAVVRRLDGNKSRLEFPIGKTLLERDGAMQGGRVSHDGEKVAITYNDGGKLHLAVVDRVGTQREIASFDAGFPGQSQLIWKYDDSEIWHSSFDGSDRGAIQATSLKGVTRTVLRLPGQATLVDMASDGRLLVVLGKTRQGLVMQRQKEGEKEKESERELTLPEQAEVNWLARDGSAIIYSVRGAATYRYHLDDNSSVRLTDGSAGPGAVSPDGKWVAVNRAAPESRTVIVPTGAGEERVVDKGNCDSVEVAGWFPDSRSYLLACSAGRKRTILKASLDIAERTEVKIPGVAQGPPPSFLISPDGTRAAQRLGGRRVFDLGSGQEVDLKGARPREQIARWSPDGRSLLLSLVEPEDDRLVVDRMDLATGVRTRVKEVKLHEADDQPRSVHITPDGTSYAYSYTRNRSDLYIVTGVK